MPLMRTIAWAAPAGSAIDPLVGEITWQAWQLVAANPARLSPESAQRVTVGFDCLVEAAWQPGRSVIVSEVEHRPDSGDSTLAAHLAVAVLGERDGTAHEARGVAAQVEAMFARQHVLAARRVDPLAVVASCGGRRRTRGMASGAVAHIRQRCWTLSDDADDVEIVSRFAPTFEPWSGVVAHLQQLGRHVRVRATVLATELSAADRIEISRGLDRVAAIRDRNDHRAQVRFDAERAEATLLDLRASLSSPVVAGEVAVWSHDPLPDSTLRSLAASFTSETDVLRRQGHVVVAANRLLLGGFDLVRDPAGGLDALAAGLPLRGGTGPRAITDLLTLTESPIGWPLPFTGPLPQTSTRVPVQRAAPRALLASDPQQAPLLGADDAGRPVGLPLTLRTRHVFVSGTWGAGKSTVLRGQALADLRAGRPFLFLDPHGSAADELIAFAAELGVCPVVIDASDGATAQLSTLPAVRSSDAEARDRAIRRVAEAVASSLPNEEWTGPRWFASFTALLELVLVHGGELLDGVVWLNDPQELRRRLGHDELSAVARSTLSNLTAATGEGADVRGWVSSKLNPIVGGTVRRILAPAGAGTDFGDAVAAGRPVIASLASLSPTEGNLVGHLVLAEALDTAFARPVGQRSLFTCYVDEAHRFPAAGLARALAEGRKFGIGLMLALQSLGQAHGRLDDLALGAGTHVVFRSTPQSAAALAPVVQVTAAELINQPDLHAVVGVQGLPPAAIVVPPPETCPVPRRILALSPIPRRGSLDPDQADPTSALIDDFLATVRARDGQPALRRVD